MAEPIKELITQNIVSTLEGVNESAGYHQTLDVRRSDPAGIESAPWACYVFELDDIEDTPHRLTGKICWLAPYQIGVYADMREGDIPGQIITRVEADIQKALGEDARRGGYAVDTTWLPPERSTNDKGELVGTLCTVHIKYRHNENDPYTL
jgi:hypothetical protein